jgi:hypothetical protein
MLADAGDAAGAYEQLVQVAEHAPQAVPLIASEWVRLARLAGRLPEVVEQLGRGYALAPSVDVADALVQAEVARGAPIGQAREGYVRHMAQALADRRLALAGPRALRAGRRARHGAALGRARRPPAGALPMRCLRFRDPGLLLAMPGLPGLGEFSAAAHRGAVSSRRQNTTITMAYRACSMRAMAGFRSNSSYRGAP